MCQLDKFLRFNENFDLPAVEKEFTPKDFFQTREGLFVWEGFENLVLPSTSEIKETPSMKVASFDLLKDATDDQIRAELPENHVFGDSSVLCARLAGMLELQKDGQDGHLLTNGNWNIAYVQVADEVVAVDVYWCRVRQKWSVRARRLRDSAWDTGSRVLSATAA